MARPFLYRAEVPAASRGARSRHGRDPRSPVTGPRLPILRSRNARFDLIVGGVIEYLRVLWPDDLAQVRVLVAATPPAFGTDREVPRWFVDAATQTITLYRVPILRLARLHRDDELHRQIHIETCVFEAVAELLGCEPWELGIG